MPVPDVTCAPISEATNTVNGVNLGLGIIGLIGTVVSGIVVGAYATGAAAAATPATLAVWAVALAASALMAINLIHKAMDVLFHYKLACIDGERCLVGEVMKIEDNPDGDLTFNMKLAPVKSDTTVTEFKSSFQGSTLVYSDPGAGTRGWQFTPDSDSGGGVISVQQPIPLLHCEIEGTYLNDWLTALIALLWGLVALAAAALVLAATELIPVIGWIIWAIMALIALFATLFGIHMNGSASSQGSGNPNVPVGQASPDGPVITDLSNNTVTVGDFIALTGLHVLDCGHTDKGTWCEIHPVRAITKVSEAFYFGYDEEVERRMCDALQSYLNAKNEGNTATSSQALEHPRIG